MKHTRTLVMLVVAFGAGAFTARIPETARAAAPAPVATSIDLGALTLADFPSPNPALPNLRTKTLAQVDSTVFAYSMGGAPKHTHAGTTEVQLILAGTGTEWLGDKQISIAPGTFVVPMSRAGLETRSKKRLMPAAHHATEGFVRAIGLLQAVRRRSTSCRVRARKCPGGTSRVSGP